MAKQPLDNCSGAYPLFGNKYIQFGRETWDSEDTQHLVRTNLTTIDFGVAVSADTFAGVAGTDATDGVFEVDLVTGSSSNTVTISRNTQQESEQAGSLFTYMFIGTQDVTD
jgi:hypothetical protein